MAVASSSANGLLVWSTPGATVGLVVEDGVVVATPPYAHRWAYGRDARTLWVEGRRRGVDVTWIPRPEGAKRWADRARCPSPFEKPPSSSG